MTPLLLWQKLFISESEEIIIEQGPSVGALYTVHSVAQRLGIVSALSSDQEAKLALWQICARVIEQGSRLFCGSHGRSSRG